MSGKKRRGCANEVPADDEGGRRTSTSKSTAKKATTFGQSLLQE